MEANNVKDLFLRECVRAIPWGIMLLLVLALGLSWMKQDVKKAIEYTVQVSARETKAAVLDAGTFVPLKQNVKEAIEFGMHTAIREAKEAALAADTFVPIKQNVKEVIEFTARTAANEYERVQMKLKK